MPVRARTHHVIIGASAAGLAALEAIRSVDRACRVTLLSRERGPLYSRVGLTHFLDGTVAADGMAMHTPEQLARLDATLLAGVAAVRVNPAARTVLLSNRRRLAYDTLLVASGSSAAVPPIPGVRLRGVFACITRRDALAIHRAIPRARRAAVIGAGLIGIQAADALAKRKKRVAILEQADHLMPAMVDAAAARLFEGLLRAHGHTVRTGARVAAIRGQGGRVAAVELESGERLPCSLLILAAGVQPNVEFLEGTRIRPGRGIRVDARQRTGLRGIYAAGDVAETTDMLSGERTVNAVWPEALNQGRVAGLNMAGVPTRYQGSLAMNTTSVLGLPVASLGVWQVTDTADHTVYARLDEAKREYRKLVFRGTQLVGALLVGEPANREAGILHTLIRTRQAFSLTPEQIAAGPLTWGRILRDNRLAGSR